LGEQQHAPAVFLTLLNELLQRFDLATLEEDFRLERESTELL
jgi:hypothetical protein